MVHIGIDAGSALVKLGGCCIVRDLLCGGLAASHYEYISLLPQRSRKQHESLQKVQSNNDF